MREKWYVKAHGVCTESGCMNSYLGCRSLVVVVVSRGGWHSSPVPDTFEVPWKNEAGAGRRPYCWWSSRVEGPALEVCVVRCAEASTYAVARRYLASWKAEGVGVVLELSYGGGGGASRK